MGCELMDGVDKVLLVRRVLLGLPLLLGLLLPGLGRATIDTGLLAALNGLVPVGGSCKVGVVNTLGGVAVTHTHPLSLSCVMVDIKWSPCRSLSPLPAFR